VQTTPLDEIAEGMRVVGKGRNPDAQLWSPEAVEEQVRGGDKPAAVRLLEFVKRHSADGKHIAEGLKVSPRFGFYVRGTDPAGSAAMLMIFAYNVARGYVRVNFNSAEELAGSELMNLLREKLKAMFGNDFDATRPNPSVSLDSYAKRADQFEHTMLWFKQEVERGATER
jgi:hypothetical protein